jgi:hypothetical protein
MSSITDSNKRGGRSFGGLISFLDISRYIKYLKK